MTRRRHAILPSLLCALALGCADKTPVTIDHHTLPGMVLNGSYFHFDASALNKKGEAIPGLKVTATAVPAEVLEVATNGSLRCAGSGDVTLTLAAGPLTEQVPIKCRIPTEITAPKEMQLILGRPAVALAARALGEGGRPMADVPVEVSSSDAAIVAAEGGKARPVAVGRARLTASSGGVSTVVPVEVVDSVISEPLTLRDGAARTFTLQPANYLVMIDLKSDARLKQGVTVSWSGAACDNQPESVTHRFQCRVAEAATMTVKNPVLMGVGATVTGTLNVHRIPD